MRPSNLLCAAIAAGAAACAAGFAQDSVTVVDRPLTNAPNTLYAGARAPLLPSPLIKLPIGAVKPRGWLRKQLELEADGFTGHLTEISDFCKPKNNAWLSPTGEGANGWEEVPYWFRGFAALGYVLGDERIIAEAKPWIEAAIASQTDFGYFGPRANLREEAGRVPPESLTTPDGQPGLKGEYYAGRNFETLKATRVDREVSFNWKNRAPLEGFTNRNCSVRWTGRIATTNAGDYLFAVQCDDGARLWVDGKLLIDNWTVQAPRRAAATNTVRFEAGAPHDVKLEFFQAEQDSEIQLAWKTKAYSYRGAPDMMPNMSMMFALRSYHEYTGDPRIIDLLTRYFRWQLRIPDKQFFSGGWQVPRNGDNLDSVYWLYNRTGEPFLLELADKLRRCGATWMKAPNACHNVDFSMGFRKPAQFYPQNRDPEYLAQAERNFAGIYDIYGQVPGGMFAGDEFARPGFTDPRNAIETCGIVDMMLSLEILTGITGDSKWADRCENAAYNSLPASMTADMKGLRYLTSVNQIVSDRRNKAPELADGGDMQSMNPYSHRCCQHNSGMGWPFFAESLWQATPGNGLAAVFYAPCEVRAKAGDGAEITIAETTSYPFDGRVDLAFDCAKPARFPLYLRVPGWCAKPQVTLNGKALAAAAPAGAYVRIERAWAKGDALTLVLPMEVTVQRWAKNRNSASVNRGPLSFSVKIGESYTKCGGTDKWPAWEILPTTPWNYGLVLDDANPAAGFEVVTRPWPETSPIFSHEGTPVELRARAKKIPNWTDTGMGLPGKLQPSPIKSSEPTETITLIPMGAARLRIASFPVIGAGSDARDWQPTEPVPASFWPAPRAPELLRDGRLPSKGVKGVDCFKWVGWAGAGTGEKHWVRQDFEQEETVDSCEIFWAAENDGWLTSPVYWKLYYLAGADWKEADVQGGYPFASNRFVRASFSPVKTRALKIEAQTRPRKSAGIFEWRSWAREGAQKRHTVVQSFGTDIMGDPVVKSVAACDVTWHVDADDPASRPPASWKLYAMRDGRWEEVSSPGAYGVEADRPNTVTFAPVRTTAMRMDILCDAAGSAGPREWKIRTDAAP